MVNAGEEGEPALVQDTEADNVGNFVFDEAEFESAEFNASNFFNKHKNIYNSMYNTFLCECNYLFIVSFQYLDLDAMKSELESYRDCLNNQLYDIINKDYKDFIGITSQLEGI